MKIFRRGCQGENNLVFFIGLGPLSPRPIATVAFTFCIPRIHMKTFRRGYQGESDLVLFIRSGSLPPDPVRSFHLLFVFLGYV